MKNCPDSEYGRKPDNPVFADYLGIYERRLDDFNKLVEESGIPFEETEESPRSARPKESDGISGLHCDNDGKSFWRNWISPACIACRTASQTATFFISLRCNRHCWFCFNPNQENYRYHLTHERNIVDELQKAYDDGIVYKDLAVTGGEPMLHIDHLIEFIKLAKKLYPDCHVRVYTSGDSMDGKVIARLEASGLDEIRFSLKLEDSISALMKTVDTMTACVGHIPSVMVEMPVFPDRAEDMRYLLRELNEIKITGINLLELCYPFHNAEQFVEHGFSIRRRPYRPLYNYWYAGGLPIAGSEKLCLELLEFARENKLGLGVHYCSLDNKHTGQIYQQNHPHALDYPYCVFSPKDYFFKSVKVFGPDVEKVHEVLREKGLIGIRKDEEWPLLEFNPEYLPELAYVLPDIEIGICSHVVEQRDDEPVLVEVDVIPTTLQSWERDDAL